jgi:hypothetical protein
MDTSMYKKMRVESACTATVLYAPEGYPKLDELNWLDARLIGGSAACSPMQPEQLDFVHLFVESCGAGEKE